jgi:glycosyltransferase involved in cell wall biosynthesis
MASLLILEPFYGGSHRRLVEAVVDRLPPAACCLVTMPGSKWHWRARTAALAFSQKVPRAGHSFVTLLASSVLSLAELLGLRPDLLPLRKVVYFHESQLDYPVRKEQERDFQYGYNQITTCLVADVVVFNSCTLRDSFLGNIVRFLKRQPDQRPDAAEIVADVEAKSCVIYFPLVLPPAPHIPRAPSSGPLHLVWPHRWEHDKDPEAFFRVVFQLLEEGLDFRVSVIGQTYGAVPEVFVEAERRLAGRLGVFGFKADKTEFYAALAECDVVVSTARHETYGVAMLEAAALGCYPLVPDRLVYPELYPAECLYGTEAQLLKRLRAFCRQPGLLQPPPPIEFERFAGPAPLGSLLDCCRLD